jgi:3-hydroxyisobutyrate dehydrogenase-like beta-hydroxyacid dehydrogenase
MQLAKVLPAFRVSPMKVGFVGLGAMGRAMAGLLVSSGCELAVYNRTRERAEGLREWGVRVADSPADVARDAEMVVTMLADDAAVEAAVFGAAGLLAGLPPDAVHIACSTISVALSERLAAAHVRAGQRYVAAPVFGRPDAAARKELWILAAGASADIERCMPVLEALGRGVTRLGSSAPTANVVKLAGNFLIASMNEALGESFALTRKAGVEPEAFLGLFVSAFARSPIFERYASSIARDEYEPAGFKARLGLKDLRLVLAAADTAEVPMPLASLVRDHLLTAVAQGKGDLDWSVIGRLAAERAGLGTKK